MNEQEMSTGNDLLEGVATLVDALDTIRTSLEARGWETEQAQFAARESLRELLALEEAKTNLQRVEGERVAASIFRETEAIKAERDLTAIRAEEERARRMR